ncbi:uncharacterized protein (TIGR02301 family) [Rhodopseudomonas julia]|uniref:Uncharacterized protein (TIGR02301 family) n=1 Tax=Rhodopseudomonas julia TaxID=200617 RepID=A0ABU0C2P5_9BRAD|nr:TIGR02301 family protein [Rhodopseudomonas julia]MDQ0324781.1 uncharacterized protein (TIGR02301 family) [Rhodopseudomonas julia]
MRRPSFLLILVFLISLAAGQTGIGFLGTASAQEGGDAAASQKSSEPPPPIYEPKLLRLSELLGALYFLRNLCGADDGPAWKADMEAMLAAEAPGPERKARLIGRFNHGFETYNAVYENCTPAAEASIARYLKESAEIASDIRTRYGQ